MKGSRLLNLILTLTLLLVLSVGWAQAQEQGADEESQPRGGEAVAAILEDAIPIQGRLTDASGVPLTGDHSVTFSLYDDPAAGILLCSTNYNPLPLTNGLFNVTMTGCTDTDIDGEQLYLGVQVDADAEMTPRQPIYAVPYARSLRPGADIRGDVVGSSILALYNTSTSDGSKGLFADALGVSGKTYGVFGQSSSPDGYGGYFYNNSLNGVGLYASGGTSIAADLVLGGTASGGNDDDGRIVSDPAYTGSDIYLVSNDAIVLALDSDDNEDGDLEVQNSSQTTILKASEDGTLYVGGSGIIQSEAPSYLWISGNGLQKAVSDDTTRFEYDEYGGYKVSGGANWGTVKRVVLPVTIPGQLYGQNVTVTGMDLYYTIPFDLTAIDAIILRRQNGVGAGNVIMFDDTDLVCAVAQCVKHWDLTQNNVLSDQQGILHLVLRLAFSGEAAYVQIGGVRLTLEHK